MEWLAALIGAFLLGSIPFGYVISRAQGIDIRTVGSGNIGATNVMRALDKKLGAAVLLLDVSKGLVPALLTQVILCPSFVDTSGEWAFWTGFAAMLGHCFSPFLRFRGGKGVATGLGLMLIASPVVALGSLGTFVIAFLICRYVSLSSIIAVGMMPAYGFALGHPPRMILCYAVLGGFIILRHVGNIRKLICGTERKFGSAPSLDVGVQPPCEHKIDAPDRAASAKGDEG